MSYALVEASTQGRVATGALWLCCRHASVRLCVIAPLLHIFLLLLQQLNMHYMLLSPPGNNQVTAVTLGHVNVATRDACSCQTLRAGLSAARSIQKQPQHRAHF